MAPAGENGHDHSVSRPKDGDTSRVEPSSSSHGPIPGAIGPEDRDSWSVNESIIARIHRQPRTTLYVPNAEDFPEPLE